MNKDQAIAKRVTELEREYEAWKYRQSLKDVLWLQSWIRAAFY